MNKNIPRLGGMAAILAMAGATAVVRNSEADPSGMGRVKDQPPGWISHFGAIQDSVRDGVRDEIPPLFPLPGMYGDTTTDLVQLAYRAGVGVGRSGGNTNLNPELGRELTGLTLKNVDLQRELDATRTQVEELMIRLETAHEEEVDGNGCPATCTNNNAASGAILCSGASCLF